MKTKTTNLLTHLPIIAAEFDSELNVTSHSPTFKQWTSQKHILGQKLSELLPNDLYLQLQAYLRKARSGRYAEFTIETQATPNGLINENYRVHITPENSHAEAKLLLTAVPLGTNKVQPELNKASEYLPFTLDTLDQGITIYDRELRLIAWNPAYEHMQIFPPEFVHFNASLKDAYRAIAQLGVLGEGNPETLAEEHIQAIKTQNMVIEEELYPPTGRIIKIHRYYLPGGGMCATFTDITDQKNYENRLIEQANLDSLTQIPNRHSALKTLALETLDQENPQPFHLLFIDLDRFKLINDTYGHHVGDELLTEVVQRLRQEIDENQGDIIARIGGDEFIIILKSTGIKAEIDAICEGILKAIESPFANEDFTIFISCSIGISSYPDQGKTSHEIISQADTAMYHAKLEGRNTYEYYTHELGARLTKRTLIANTLRRHLHTSLSPIYLVFQPIVELQTGRTVAAEALLRWEKLNQYHATIDELVSIIEEHGMIMEVGNHVIDLSISSLHALLQSSENSPFYLSINASPIQVTQKGFAERFISGFSSEHLSPNCISLEITETALMQNTDIVLENLKMIRDAGFNLAIDDFGTGYSSLSYLEKYPFTHLKIDKSFIDHIPGNNQKTHLLNAIMDISRAFKMKVIAEGIESQDQMQYLKGIGCHLGQGYYFGRPEPLEQFRTRLQETNEAVCMA